MNRVAYLVLFSECCAKAAGYEVFLRVLLTENSRKHSCLPTKDYIGLLLSMAQNWCRSDLKPCCHMLCSGKVVEVHQPAGFLTPSRQDSYSSREQNMTVLWIRCRLTQ